MIITKVIDFPTTKVSSATCETPEGDTMIYINARMGTRKQIEAYIHELLHHLNHDMEKANADEIERERHKEGK